MPLSGKLSREWLQPKATTRKLEGRLINPENHLPRCNTTFSPALKSQYQE